MAKRYDDRERRGRRVNDEDWDERTQSYRDRWNRGYDRQTDYGDWFGTRGYDPRLEDEGRGYYWREDAWNRPRRDWDWERDTGSQNRGWYRGMDYDRDREWGGRNTDLEQGFTNRGDRGLKRDTGYGRNYGTNAADRSRDWRRDWDRGRTDWEEDFGEDWAEDLDAPTYWVYEEWWVVPGPFSGVGPRGYQRSDDRIFEDVCERLSQHGQIDASEVDVEVKDGEVILRGSVDNRRSKRLAEDIVEDVQGIVNVRNELRVHQQEGRLTGQTGTTRQEGQMVDQSGAMQGQESQMREVGQGATAMTDRIQEGLPVIDSEGRQIGKVKQVRSNDFLLDRPMARDIYVPFNASRLTGGQVALHLRAGEIDNQNWPKPEIIETPDLPGNE